MSSNFHPDGTLFIVSGPSGAGKTTLINRVQTQLRPLSLQLHFSVSHTTRPPRASESDGIDYHFVDTETFNGMIERGEFIEHAHVHAHLYGTSKSEVQWRLAAGQDVILDIDYQGAKQIDEDPELGPRSMSVFIFPPSLEELEQRLRYRGNNSDEEIRLRLQKAIAEIDAGKEFYKYVIINDELEVAAECLKAAIIAQKLQTKTALESIALMAERFKEEHRNGRTSGGR
jgi:guanylate kinase